MSEEENLLARIGELAGQINRRKNQDVSQPWPTYPQRPQSAIPVNHASHHPIRASPYDQRRGQKYHNRSLVLNKHGNPAQAPVSDQIETSSDENASPRLRGASKYGRGAKAWISEETLRRKLERRKEFVGKTEWAENGSTAQDVQARALPSKVEDLPTASHYTTINGISFQVTDGGNKLVRVMDSSISAKVTPKEATVSGVAFTRTKKGNLIRIRVDRQGFVCENRPKLNGKTKLCRRYTSTGQCARGNKCFGIHDIDRTAICQSVLRGTKCAAGDECDLTHDSSPQVAPTCLHFLRGNCVKYPCPYSHAAVSPSAPLCRDFAYLGYCGQGTDCGQRHLRECPDYDSNAGCHFDHCALPHYDRASQMRRNAANQAGAANEPDVDSARSRKEDSRGCDSDDLDSDEVQQPEPIFGSDPYQPNQQQDFVGLI